MNSLIPSFIGEQFDRNQFEGNFQAWTMFIDISGFTAMTEALMVNGKEGAEVLTDVINRVFTPAIEAVYEHKGFVSSFAGDAFTSIFPSDSVAIVDSLSAAVRIQGLFRDKGKQQTKFGPFELSVKIGLSFGHVEWGIIQDELQNAYYFKGEAIDNSTRNEQKAQKGEIIIDNNLFSKIIDAQYVQCKKRGEHHYILQSAPVSQIESVVVDLMLPANLDKFIPEEIISLTTKGEFREIVSCFISFQEKDSLSEGISKVIALAHSFDGYFNKIDFGDKGGMMLVLFGAPVNPGNLYNRALDFALATSEIPELSVRIGLTYGTAFTGFLGSDLRSEFTAIGTIVNLSARFVMSAEWGDIFVDQNIYGEVKEHYEIVSLPPRHFKGIAKEIPVFKLIQSSKHASVSMFHGQMVGREEELEQLSQFLKPIKNGKFGGIVHIYGNPGIGKSRLIHELTQHEGILTLTMQTDSILKGSLNPFSYFFKHYFEQSKATLHEDRKDIFKAVYQKFVQQVETGLVDDERLESIVKNLHRIESIIGAIIGLEWEGSIYSIIEAKDRPVVTQFAIKDFITTLSLFEPVILHIEDIQWLDNESQNIFEILTRMIDNYPLVILACSRFNDDGSKPVLKSDEEVLHQEVILNELPADTIKSLIGDRLGHQAEDELTEYIHSRTEGNPFYTEQFCLYLRENDFIKLTDKQYHLTKGKDASDVPSNINLILIARIDRLSVELKETVQIASILGREFEVKLLTELIALLTETASKGESSLHGHDIQPLVTAGKEEQVWNRLTELRYIFSHALLRDAVYEMQLKARLRDLHKLAGDTIVKLFSDEKEKYAEIANHYEKAEDWEKAREYFTKAGEYFRDSVKYNEASKFFQKALSISEKIFEPDDPKVAGCMNDQAEIYMVQGLYDKAKPSFERVLDINKKVLGMQHPLVATNLINLADVYLNQGLFDKAKPLHCRSLEIREKVLGKDHPDTAQGLNNLANLLQVKGDYDGAEPLYRKAFEIYEKVRGKDHPNTATSWNNLAMLLNAKGDSNGAEQLHRRSLEIREKVQGKDHPNTAASLNNLAVLLYMKGDYDGAEPLIRRSLEIMEKVLGKDHPDNASSLNSLATLLKSKGDYDGAEPLYCRALEICEKVRGKDHPYTATSLNNLATLLYVKGDYDGAEPLYRRALEIREKVQGKNHPDTAQGLNNLAQLLYEKGNYDGVEPLLRRALEIREKVQGKDHPDTAGSLNNLAYLLRAKGNYDGAEPLYRRALEIREKVRGKDHPNTAQSLNNLAVLLRAKGDYDKAEPLFKRAIKIWQKALPDHPKLTKTIDDYAKLLEDTDRPEETQAIRDRNKQ